MPTGKVKFFKEDSHFGFILDDETRQDVYFHAKALPVGAKVRPGTRVEYSVGETKRGPEALTIEILPEHKSLAKAARRKPAELVPIVEDLIKILDAASGDFRRGRYPEGSPRIAKALRALADDFDA